jgi:hypothetical protein
MNIEDPFNTGIRQKTVVIRDTCARAFFLLIFSATVSLFIALFLKQFTFTELETKRLSSVMDYRKATLQDIFKEGMCTAATFYLSGLLLVYPAVILTRGLMMRLLPEIVILALFLCSFVLFLLFEFLSAMLPLAVFYRILLGLLLAGVCHYSKTMKGKTIPGSRIILSDFLLTLLFLINAPAFLLCSILPFPCSSIPFRLVLLSVLSGLCLFLSGQFFQEIESFNGNRKWLRLGEFLFKVSFFYLAFAFPLNPLPFITLLVFLFCYNVIKEQKCGPSECCEFIIWPLSISLFPFVILAMCLFVDEVTAPPRNVTAMSR